MCGGAELPYTNQCEYKPRTAGVGTAVSAELKVKMLQLAINCIVSDRSVTTDHGS